MSGLRYASCVNLLQVSLYRFGARLLDLSFFFHFFSALFILPRMVRNVVSGDGTSRPCWETNHLVFLHAGLSQKSW